ncbi:MAG: transposase [Phycisphaerae bacterium]
MRERIIKRYSTCFKLQVISELETGRFESIEAARRHYDIRGNSMIQRWLRRYGKNHLQAKVVRVEMPDERDRIREYKKQIAELQRALGRTQAENVMSATFLELACQELGRDVDTFKKKVNGLRFTVPPEKGASP